MRPHRTLHGGLVRWTPTCMRVSVRVTFCVLSCYIAFFKTVFVSNDWCQINGIYIKKVKIKYNTHTHIHIYIHFFFVLGC